MISRLLQAAPWDASGRGSRGCGGKVSHSCKKIISFAAYFPLLLQTVAVPEPRSAGHADSHARPRCAPLKSPGLRAGVATPRRRLGCGKSGQVCLVTPTVLLGRKSQSQCPAQSRRKCLIGSSWEQQGECRRWWAWVQGSVGWVAGGPRGGV